MILTDAQILFMQLIHGGIIRKEQRGKKSVVRLNDIKVVRELYLHAKEKEQRV